MTANSEQRYRKQTLFDPIGEAGQANLARGRALVVGCGALGSVISETLVRAGVGFVRIVDRDFVEISNLQRQVLFDEQDVADRLPKAVAANSVASTARTRSSGWLMGRGAAAAAGRMSRPARVRPFRAGPAPAPRRS